MFPVLLSTPSNLFERSAKVKFLFITSFITSGLYVKVAILTSLCVFCWRGEKGCVPTLLYGGNYYAIIPEGSATSCFSGTLTIAASVVNNIEAIEVALRSALFVTATGSTIPACNISSNLSFKAS